MSTEEEESNQEGSDGMAVLELIAAIQSARIDYKNIPPALMEGLKAYAETGRPTGDFLRCVLANDFLQAVGRADMNSMRALPSIAAYVYNELPSECHGSQAVYATWILLHEAKRSGKDEVIEKAWQTLLEAKQAANEWKRPVRF